MITLRSWTMTATLAIAIGAGSSAAIAQSAAPAASSTPIGPRLIAPHDASFLMNAVDPGPTAIPQAQWSAAGGTWQTSTEDGNLEAHGTFRGLVPGGRYSLFLRHVANGKTVIEPVDASGSTDTFVASPQGTTIVTTAISQTLVSGDEVLLVYRTATPANLKQIGRLGTDAFIQLRLKQP